MIHVLFRQSPDAPVVDVLIDETKHSVEAVLAHAAKRAGRPLTVEQEVERDRRYLEMMVARKK